MPISPTGAQQSPVSNRTDQFSATDRAGANGPGADRAPASRVAPVSELPLNQASSDCSIELSKLRLDEGVAMRSPLGGQNTSSSNANVRGTSTEVLIKGIESDLKFAARYARQGEPQLREMALSQAAQRIARLPEGSNERELLNTRVDSIRSVQQDTAAVVTRVEADLQLATGYAQQADQSLRDVSLESAGSGIARLPVDSPERGRLNDRIASIRSIAGDTQVLVAGIVSTLEMAKTFAEQGEQEPRDVLLKDATTSIARLPAGSSERGRLNNRVASIRAIAQDTQALVRSITSTLEMARNFTEQGDASVRDFLIAGAVKEIARLPQGEASQQLLATISQLKNMGSALS